MNRLNIVLDLDQTLIAAIPVEEFPFNKKGIKEKALKFPIHNMDEYYIVFERPYLDKFLDFLFENFNVIVWTAASKDYALFIIDKIIQTKPERKLKYIFFSYHCELSKNYSNGPKKLDMLWEDFKLQGFDKNNTIIIDDLDKVCKDQPCNCIPAPPFEFEDEHCENDTFLKDLIPKLERLRDIYPTLSGDVCLTNYLKT